MEVEKDNGGDKILNRYELRICNVSS